MKLSDYVIRFIADLGVKHVFMLAGGGAMHLNDSLGRCDELKYTCNLHEQACAIAADAYARVTNGLGVAIVTTGPGGTNTVTGVAGSWLDSTPVLFISGQVKRADLKRDSGVRILGVQEIDIVSIVDSITKYSVTVEDPASIRYHLEKAVHLALTGRRGPVWIDIPLDVQASQIDASTLTGYHDSEIQPRLPVEPQLHEQVTCLIRMLNGTQRPVLLVGNGVRAAGAEGAFLQAAERVGIPVLTTWLGFDQIPEDHSLNFGRPGSLAPRGANFTLQNCDLLLSVGARLDMAMTGYAHDRFARAAKKVMVDVDPAEIKKMKTEIHLPIVADAGAFFQELNAQSESVRRNGWPNWLDQCRRWKARYPVVLPEHRDLPGHLSMYHFSEVLSEELEPCDTITPGSSGFAVEIFLLCLKIKRGQRCFHNRGIGAMGLGLPAAIGAAVATGGRTVCLEGDGGFQMNIQELATVHRLGLPIKFFVANNEGYASIRASQLGYFKRLTGADATSGVALPDLREVSRAYGLPFVRISGKENLNRHVRKVLDTPGPVVCEVVVASDEERIPRASSYIKADGSMGSKPLEDLYPFLDREELAANMLVDRLDE